MVQSLSVELAEYLTNYTDYMINLKIPIKDISITRLYLEPFKWDFIKVDIAKLGKSVDLLTKCLNSNYFWKSLKKSHEELRVKYPL